MSQPNCPGLLALGDNRDNGNRLRRKLCSNGDVELSSKLARSPRPVPSRKRFVGFLFLLFKHLCIHIYMYIYIYIYVHVCVSAYNTCIVIAYNNNKMFQNTTILCMYMWVCRFVGGSLLLWFSSS